MASELKPQGGLSGSLSRNIELKGAMTNLNELNGSLKNEVLRGYSAYQVAVALGFEGTEEEWLESLKGSSDAEVTVKSITDALNYMPADANDVEKLSKDVEELKEKEVDLTGYATENYVQSYAQPKGDYAASKHTHSEYLTEHQDLKDYAKKSDIPTDYAKFEHEHGQYLTSIPDEYVTESELADKKYLTSIPSEYITESELNSKGYLTEHQSLTDYAKKSELPIKTSQLTNDSGFLTQHQSLANYYTKTETYSKSEVDTKTSELSREIVDLETQVANQELHTQQIETNKNDIDDLKENKANITDVKAWIVQQWLAYAESKDWLDENGDTTKLYSLNGELYAYMYKESTKPPYKNWREYATDTDHTTIFDGKGYKDGVRLNSSGVQTSCTGMMITGFIPCKKGDIIRIKDNGDTTTAYSQNVSFYDSSNTHLAYTSLPKDNSDEILAGFTRSDDKTLITISTGSIKQTSSITNCAYVRMASGDWTNAIITINEEIVEGGSSGGYGWYPTGYSLIHNDYEDRIVALETTIENGDFGNQLSITKIQLSNEDGGSNVVTFSDGKTLTIKNGRTGSKGLNGSNGRDGTTQIEPLFAESVTWLNANGDTSKLYILTDNYVYAYINGAWTNTGNLFISSGIESSVQKYLNDRNTYIAPVPSGYCESLNEYSDYSVKLNEAVDLATQMARFSALATSYPNYVTETLLGKDSSNTYDIYKYELELNPPISDGYTSVMTKNKPVFIITSGLHGIEHDAVDSVYHFMKDLCENYMDSDYFDYLRNNVKFVVVPISNPWGYTNLTYNNANDVNLNKNFEHGFVQVNGGTGSQQNTGASAYSEVEAQYLKSVFDEYSNAIFHLECHGKAQNDTEWGTILWFSNMASLKSELIELCSTRTIHQVGCRLHKLGFSNDTSEVGYMTYYTLNGRPKDYTGTEYGMLSTTMEGTGRMGVAGHTTYTKHEQRINCEALENFILRVLDSLNSRVEI